MFWIRNMVQKIDQKNDCESLVFLILNLKKNSPFVVDLSPWLPIRSCARILTWFAVRGIPKKEENTKCDKGIEEVFQTQNSPKRVP